MRVKLFQNVVSVSAGSSPGRGNFGLLESDINKFLDEHPSLRVIDLKITSNAAPVGNIVTNYGAIAILLYEEPAA
ncbi:MAG TPA: hypothetical protein VJQ44_07525 [Gemmatimonadales bacterium]|nr:hypothetical protein [Gemmatimonadales bacterium]